MDFVSDGLANGRRLRCLTIVDDCTRECLAIEVDTSLPGTRVAATLDRLAELRGLPRSITVDHGPEFACTTLPPPVSCPSPPEMLMRPPQALRSLPSPEPLPPTINPASRTPSN